MGKRDRYAAGTFSWVELATPDPRAAVTFYRSLFGWEAEENPIPEEAGGGVYTMLLVDGERVAGLSEQPIAQRDAGVPPNWFSYVTVADADAASARAAELGGTVHAGPFDVMDTGRMAVIADPSGAMFGVWQAGTSIGATLVNEPGVPPHWMPYFTATSLDDAVERTRAGGGAVHFGPIEIPAGRIAVVADPQGASFGLFEGDVDP